MNPDSKRLFVTDNLKLAAALTAVGFELKATEYLKKTVDSKKRDLIICEFDPSHLGVAADYLQKAFEGVKWAGIDLPSQVDEIIRKRAITDEEYILLAFDAARSALNNRSAILFCVGRQKPLHCVSIGNGRTLVYREGIEKEELQKLLDNA